MGRLPELTARQARTLHGWSVVGWALLAPPSILLWRESIVWLVIMSHLTALLTSFSAWQAARAEEAGWQNP